VPITAAMCASGRVLGDARLSPAGDRVAFVASEGGRARLVVVDAGGGPELVVSTEPAPAAARPGGSGVFDWDRDGASLVYVGVDGGLWRQPAAGGPPSCLWPADRGPVGAPATGPGGMVAFVVDFRDVVVVDADGGHGTYGGQDFAADPAVSADGRRVAWLAWDVPAMAWDASRIVELTDGITRVVAGGDGISVQQPRYGPNGELAYLSDESGWLNLRAGDQRFDDEREHGGPTWGMGQRSHAWSPDGRSLAVTRNEGGYSTLVLWAPGEPEPAVVLCRGIHTCLSWAGGRIAAVRSGARTPTQVVVYDVHDTERRILAVGPVAGFDDGVEPEMVTWTADDGAIIPGRLYRAPGERLLVWVHGGPTDQWQVEFRARFAYWLDRGWSILVPDHRGSTGHGRAFTQAMAGRWGELDVADVAAGARACLANGWGGRLVAMGASAGGFTVLNLLAEHPGLFAAGVSLYGIGDLLELSQATHRFEAHYNLSLVGPLPEAADRYRSRSPLHRADHIVDPLLLLHGSADPVVPVRQSEAMAARLTALGRPVELHVYDGEGHGWGRREVVVDELERTDDFLRRHA